MKLEQALEKIRTENPAIFREFGGLKPQTFAIYLRRAIRNAESVDPTFPQGLVVSWTDHIVSVGTRDELKRVRGDIYIPPSHTEKTIKLKPIGKAEIVSQLCIIATIYDPFNKPLEFSDPPPEHILSDPNFTITQTATGFILF